MIMLLLISQFRWVICIKLVTKRETEKLDAKLPSGLQKSNGNTTRRKSLWPFRLALPYWSYLSNVTTNMRINMLGSLKSNQKFQLVY